MDIHRQSVLDYARAHGVAFDFVAISPLKYIDQIGDILSPRIQVNQRALDDYTSAMDSTTRTEKLDVSKDDALFLSTVLQEARAERTTSGVNWDSILPAPHRHDKIKLDPPLIKSDTELDLSSLKRRGLLDLNDVPLPAEPATSTGCQNVLLDVTEEIQKDRLECTKESLGLIQDARRSGELSRRELEGLGDSCLGLVRGRSQPGSEHACRLLPFDFDDASPSPPSPPKHMLPSPLSSIPSEKARRHEPATTTTTTINPAPLQLLRYSNARERVWLLGSSDIGDMEGASSLHEAGTSPDPWDGPDGTAESLVSGEPSSRGECTGKAEPTGMDRARDAASDTGRPRSGNRRLVQVVKQEDEQPEMKAISTTESDHGMTGHSPSLGSAAFYHGEHGIRPDIRGSDSELDKFQAPSPIDNPHGPTKQPPGPKEIAFSEMDIMSVAEQGGISYPVAESVERMSIDPSSPVMGYEHENPSVEAGHDEIPVKEERADNPRTTPREEAESLLAEPSYVKRKREGPDVSPRKYPRQEKAVPAGAGAGQNEPTPATPFTPLGSLSSFMETRGVAPQPQPIEKSPYFGESKPNEYPVYMSEDTSLKEETPEETALAITQQTPQIHPTQSLIILFLSSALLKTHVQVVKFLETMENPPALIYRDYGDPEETDAKANTSSPGQTTPLDADIIISPNRGIVLTTSQAAMQLYLPGHRPSSAVGRITSIDSPLRERIFVLAPRYEQLYIFISHNMDQGEGSGQKPTADRRTLSALTSLTAFCNSASTHATITPVFVPSTPEIIGEWVVSLARKHALTGPRFRTANNRTTGLRIVPSALTVEKASNWELFLRQAGMNPFAALTTLSIMRKAEREDLESAGQTTDEFVYKFDRKRRVRSLSKFMEMSRERRKELLEGIVGGRVLSRVEELVELDWQCDWALDFHDR